MIYSNAKTQRVSQMINFICGLFFALFCLLYLLFFQSDFLSFAQHFYSNARNVFHGYIFAWGITFFLTLLGCVLQVFIHLPIRLRALHWIPSCFLLTYVTSFDLYKFTSTCDTSRWWVNLLFLIIFGFVYYVALRVQELRNENTTLSALLWGNLLILAFGFMYVTACSNTNKQLHEELKIERAIGEERWEDALDMIKKVHEKSRINTSLAYYALSQQNALGERFCEYATKEGSNYLLPLPIDSLRPWNPIRLIRAHIGGTPGVDMDATRYLEYLCYDSISTNNANDYLLTSCLLDRKVEEFSKYLTKYYPPKDTINQIYGSADSLPRNYKEALLFYTLTSPISITSLEDSLLTNEYMVFDSLKSTITNTPEKKKVFDEEFQNTYWYYYDFLK